MSVSSIPSLGDMIDPPIQIVLSNNNKDVSQFEEQCVFWEKGLGNKPGKWSSRGCKFVESNLSHTICECTHMSTFSAIANTAKHKQIAIATVPPTSPQPEPEESNVLYILLGILALLMIILVLMAVVYLIWKRRKGGQQERSTTNSRAESRGSGKSRSDESLSTGSEEFDDMMASRRRNVHPDIKKGPMNSPRWQRMRKNGENPEDLMLKEKSYLFSDYHQPYHFLSAKTPEPSSSNRRQRSRSS
ncbi:uncharacterized protein LOC110245178 [Exaiptasia diaphana]|uniref:GAIN-B domain-containing protein n=1 Tax=Exaiptasia diaphana TaxID=2652724 RepID=A0A913XP24_EXADI|nr:uncharacterized protein LOC110245178 [Exaiptasia diaphana]